MKKSELEAILSEVEQEVAALLNTELKKAADESSPEASAGGAPEASAGDPGAEGSPPAAAESAPAQGDTSPPGAPEGGPEGAPEGAPAPEGAAPEGAPEGAPGAEAGPADPAQLEAAYEQLPPEELKAHYLACKAAMFKLMGGADASASPSAPPPGGPEGAPGGAPGAPAMSPSAGPGPAMKKEFSSPEANGGKITKKSEMDELRVQVEVLTKALTMIAEQPVRKAVTGMSYIAKSEPEVEAKPLSKAEVTAKLTEKSADPKLAKSDRQAINDYYDGKISVEKISHLLK